MTMDIICGGAPAIRHGGSPAEKKDQRDKKNERDENKAEAMGESGRGQEGVVVQAQPAAGGQGGRGDAGEMVGDGIVVWGPFRKLSQRRKGAKKIGKVVEWVPSAVPCRPFPPGGLRVRWVWADLAHPTTLGPGSHKPGPAGGRRDGPGQSLHDPRPCKMGIKP
jgi:hypothetical protein